MQPSIQWYNTFGRRWQSWWPPPSSLSTRLRDMGNSGIQWQASWPTSPALTSLNLPCWPRHHNKHQGDDNGSGRKNVGEQDVHQGPNGCMGEKNCRAANLAESPGLFHKKMARAKTILASHRKTFVVQGCSPCSPRAGSSRERRQDHRDDVCPPPRST